MKPVSIDDVLDSVQMVKSSLGPLAKELINHPIAQLELIRTSLENSVKLLNTATKTLGPKIKNDPKLVLAVKQVEIVAGYISGLASRD